MKKARLILGSTNSLPVGASDDEIEHVYQTSLKPYLRVLYHAPQIPVTLHYSGQLLQWLEKYHSEYTDVLSEMITRKQCEILGGGFYDPVLSLIPRLDRLGQIESLTTYLRKRFGRRPRGTWITEHVWEPSLASTLRSSGMEYVFLDDYHFLTAGMRDEDLCRPCLTEDQGKTIVVFPVCHDLKLLARTEPPERIVDYLRDRCDDDGSRVHVLIDDGGRRLPERSSSPSPWLEQFVELLKENREWIEVGLPSQYVKESRPRRRAYFHSAGSEELLYWSMTPDQQDSYSSVRDNASNGSNGYMIGGHFRQFLTRYAESNQMYAKMQYTHVLVNQIRGDKYRKQAAREELWRGQCHNAYWHGQHGGIYQGHLRKQVYRALIEAEKKTRERGIFSPSIVTVDFDMDGLDEYLYQGADLNAYVHQVGGMLFELDYLPTSWNYLDTFSRQRESYHSTDDQALGYDLYPRRGFVDHFLSSDTTVEQFIAGTASERGNFTDALYARSVGKRDTQRLDLSAAGSVRANGKARLPVELEKRYEFKRGIIDLEYTIRCTGDSRLEGLFAPEINLAFESADPDSQRIFVRGGRRRLQEVAPDDNGHDAVSDIRIEDLANHTAITVTFPECDPWCFPVRTVRRTGDDGTETRIIEYQSTCIVPRFALSVDPGARVQAAIRIRFEKL